MVSNQKHIFGLTVIWINGNKIEYDLDEKTLEKRLGLKEIKLQDAEHFVDKFGSKKEILYQYQLDKTGDLDENISLNSELSKKLETKYKKDRAFYLTFWSGMLFLEIIYLIKKINIFNLLKSELICVILLMRNN